MRDPHDIVAAARVCVGTRFRAQGRMPGVGLDCVGVVAWAAGVIAPTGYDLRGSGAEQAELEMARLGFGVAGEAKPGDVLLIEPAPGLRHLAVVSGAGLVVHAHAGLRRVVEGPVEAGWTILSIWQLAEEG